MAPIKFEDNLKDKLEKRTLQPSADAWSKLSTRLDAEEKKKNTKLFWWFGIAASIVGIILVTTMFFNKSEFKNDTPEIVDTKTQKEVLKEEILNSVSKEKEEQVVVSKKVESTEDEKQSIATTKSINAVTSKSIKVVTPNKEIVIKQAVAVNDQEKQEKIQKSIETPVNTLDFEKAKIDAVVAEIKKLKTENVTVTDTEIDLLLKQAEREILKNRIYNETTRTVDANALLQDVEADLEQSFRTKVFEALKNSYDTVKTAVAERNN